MIGKGDDHNSGLHSRELSNDTSFRSSNVSFDESYNDDNYFSEYQLKYLRLKATTMQIDDDRFLDLKKNIESVKWVKNK